MKKKTKKIVSWFIYLAILFGIVFGIPQLLKIILKVDIPMASITSSSMWPTLKKGDLVLVKGLSGESIEVEDIIVYRVSSGFIVHRVIEKNGPEIITRGDANTAADKPISDSDVIGKVVLLSSKKPFRLPKLGYISFIRAK